VNRDLPLEDVDYRRSTVHKIKLCARLSPIRSPFVDISSILLYNIIRESGSTLEVEEYAPAIFANLRKVNSVDQRKLIVRLSCL